MNQVLKDAFLRLTKTFFYNYFPYNDWVTSSQLTKLVIKLDMCYYWEDLATAQAHRTIFGWQAAKLKGELVSDGQLSHEECNAANNKLREIVLDYFDHSTAVITELLYGFQGKTFKSHQINPLLQRTIDRFQLVLAIFKAQCEDSYFCQKIIDVIMEVFSGFTYPELLHSLEKRWVYLLCRVSRNIDDCQRKLIKLIHICLQVLEQLTQTRLQ